MLCRFVLQEGFGSRQKGTIWIVDVPDEVYMIRMALDGTFTLAALSNSEIAACGFLGPEKALAYAGPLTTQQPQKEKK